jgi:CheY-like chemotaxis protein
MSPKRDKRPGSARRPEIKARVVLADDNADFRAYAATVLRGAGCEVVEARDGASLLDCLDFANVGPGWAVPFDAVVADFHMPGLTGIEVLEGLAVAGVAGRVVIISGFADDDTLGWSERTVQCTSTTINLDPRAAGRRPRYRREYA